MSTTELGRFEASSPARTLTAADAGVLELVRTLLKPLASLRLTVTLLTLSLVLVLAGTLAQIDRDVWYIVRAYFQTWVAWIELRIFFPRDWGISEAVVFPFPGGKLVGAALAANLLAAHGVRFKVAARGGRLWAGWAIIAAGAAITYGVIASGSNMAVESELSPAFTNGLWHAVRALLGGGALALVYYLGITQQQARKSAARWAWWFGAVVAVLLVGLAGYLFTHPDVRLNASGLRILWQLTKALAASVVLGAGCWLVFAKRAGIVLLHSGIALLMLSVARHGGAVSRSPNADWRRANRLLRRGHAQRRVGVYRCDRRQDRAGDRRARAATGRGGQIGREDRRRTVAVLGAGGRVSA